MGANAVIRTTRSHLALFLCTIMVPAALASPAVGNEDPSGTSSLVIHLEEKSTATLYLPALFGDSEKAELLFDTGSGYLAITEELFDKLDAKGLATYQRSINARLANGQVNRVPVYTLSSLDLGNDCVLHQVDALVLAGATRNILGMNVLRRVESFSVSFNPPRLTLNGCQGKVTSQVASR